MPETFAQYLEQCPKQSTPQGLNNPLVKMPVKRFRLLQPTEFETIANGDSFFIGTMSDTIFRNFCKNALPRSQERGEIHQREYLDKAVYQGFSPETSKQFKVTRWTASSSA